MSKTATSSLPSPFRFGFFFGLGFIFAHVVASAIVLVIVAMMGVGLTSLFSGSSVKANWSGVHDDAAAPAPRTPPARTTPSR